MRNLFAVLLLLAAFSAQAAGPTTTAVNAPAQTLNNLTAKAADLHTATGDVATIIIPSYVTAYQITAVKVTNCSATPILASVGIFTAASGGGTAIVAATTITGATSSSVVLTQTLASTARLTAGTIYINLGVANVAALTCDFKVDIDDLS